VLDEEGKPLRKRQPDEERDCRFCAKKDLEDFEWKDEAIRLWNLYTMCTDIEGKQFCYPYLGGLLDQPIKIYLGFQIIKSEIVNHREEEWQREKSKLESMPAR